MDNAETKVEVEHVSNWNLVVDGALHRLETKLSLEELSKMSNKDFLTQVEKEDRLKYVTKWNIDYQDIKTWKVKNITFFFDYDKNWKDDWDLYMMTTIWQVLWKEICELKSWWKTYTRKWLSWEFFCWNKRLIIHTWTKVEVTWIRDMQEIQILEKEVIWDFQEYERVTWKDFNELDTQIIQEASRRSINVWMVLWFFSWILWKISWEKERKVELELLFTEIDRKRSRWWFDSNSEDLKRVIETQDLTWTSDKKQDLDSYETKEEFYEIAERYSKETERIYWVPWPVTFWQAIVETWHWRSKLAKEDFNFFGHTNNWTDNLKHDSWVMNNFARYDTIEEWFLSHWEFLRRYSRYNNAFAFTNEPRKFLEQIVYDWYVHKNKKLYISNVVNVLGNRGIYI